MGDNDAQSKIEELRTDLATFKGETGRAIAEVRAEVRIVKHDQANMQMGFNGFTARMEKSQDGMKSDIKEMATAFTTGFDGLKKDLAGLTVKQERGAGFFAGIAASVTVCGGFLMFLLKMLFGGVGQ